MKKTVIELFAGVGGFRCGLNNVELIDDKVKESKEWDFVWTNQWEPSTKTQDAYNCYTTRFGKDERTSNEDINTVDKGKLPDHTLLVGGFPCQDYSVARTLANGKGIEGKKGVLWWNIDGILKAKKTPFVLLENVDRLLISPASQRGRDFGIILRSLYDNGYGVEWRVINAAEYGMPQKRKRVFIFAFHKSTNYYKEIAKQKDDEVVDSKGIFAKTFKISESDIAKNEFDISTNEYEDLVEVSNNFKNQFYNAGIMINGKVTTLKVGADTEDILALKDIIEKTEVEDTYFLTKDQEEKFRYLKGSKKIPRVKPNGEPYNYCEGAMAFPDKLDSPARTMLTSETGISRSSHVVEDYITKKLRFLTPMECERINQFPDNWTNTGMTDKRRYFMMGNALVVGIIKRLNSEIGKIIQSEK